jgi:hypothetical protein
MGTFLTMIIIQTPAVLPILHPYLLPIPTPSTMVLAALLIQVMAQDLTMVMMIAAAHHQLNLATDLFRLFSSYRAVLRNYVGPPIPNPKR